jgi:tetratricopeptide (TPR) repeat protein
MVTLRVFDSALNAGLAKSLLENRGIECALADEASHDLSGAAVAVPVRLLVREDQTEEALRILDNPGPGLPEDFDPGANPEERVPEIRPDVATQLDQLRKTVRRLIIVSTILFFLLWCFVAYLLTDRPPYVTRLFMAITTASRRSDFEKARRLAERAVKQYPREYWSHERLADLEFDRKDLTAAEAEYQRAYELTPSERIRKRLQEVRARMSSQPSPSPSPGRTLNP